MLNPSESVVDVLAQVVPFGSADLLPEPFELGIPKLRYGAVNLTDESRVQQVGYHAIDVEAAGGDEVVSARSLNITGGPESDEADAVRARSPAVPQRLRVRHTQPVHGLPQVCRWARTPTPSCSCTTSAPRQP